MDVGAARLRRRHGGDFALASYVNDGPYAASSLLSVAVARVLDSALKGRCDERPGLAGMPIPLRAEVAALPCADGEPLLRAMFEPLGYAVDVTSYPLDDGFPEWGRSPYYTVAISAHVRLAALLSHLYVFEWGREPFQAWAASVGQRHRYRVRITPVGDEQPGVGAPTQMAVFTAS